MVATNLKIFLDWRNSVRVDLSFWFTTFKHQSTESIIATYEKSHIIVVWNDFIAKNATEHKINSYYTLAISYCTFCVGKHTMLGRVIKFLCVRSSVVLLVCGTGLNTRRSPSVMRLASIGWRWPGTAADGDRVQRRRRWCSESGILDHLHRQRADVQHPRQRQRHMPVQLCRPARYWVVV